MAEKKKILYIVEAMGGGVFTYIVDLANELVDTYDMYIAYAVRKQTPSNYKDYFDKRIHMIEVKNFARAINATKDIAAFFEIRKIAKEIKPDIIHLHSSKAGALGRFAFSGKRVPLFYTPHGYSFLMQNSSEAKRKIYKGIEIICGKRNCTTISCSEGEHLPISLLEAMYMKKVCIVSNIIGNRDVIHTGVNGFVCNNTEEYVKATILYITRMVGLLI